MVGLAASSQNAIDRRYTNPAFQNFRPGTTSTEMIESLNIGGVNMNRFLPVSGTFESRINCGIRATQETMVFGVMGARVGNPSFDQP